MITLDDNFRYDHQLMTHLIESRKQVNGERILRDTNGIVQHGLLKGYPLHREATWVTSDIASQLLGLYEQEVCAVIWHLKSGRDRFIDLGAADGYYGLGLIALGHFERSYCFEIEQRSRASLTQRAHSLGIEARVAIYGDARADLPVLLAAKDIDLSRTVMLCDIEGHEFDLFDDDFLSLVRNAYVVIENHDFMRSERYEESARFRARAAKHFYLSEMFVGNRDLRRIPLIQDHWNDNDRWLLCSEGRAKLASWFVLTPLGHEPLTSVALNEIHMNYVRHHWP